MIRQATVEDLPGMEAGAREFYASSKYLGKFDPVRFVSVWTNLISSQAGVIFLLIEADELEGAIGGVVYPDLYSGEIIATEFFWFVRQEHRGGGLRLYKEFEEWAKWKGASQIRMVHLQDSMPDKLERLYRHWGYQPIETHYAKEL